MCEKIRESIYCPIIFMGCMDSEEHIVKAFELGRDGYITKPLRHKELVARVKAHLRRVNHYSKLQKSIGKAIKFGNLTLDTDKHMISSLKSNICRTPLECDILIYLLQCEGQMASYSELFENVWKDKVVDDYRTLKVHVSNLKNKLRTINTEKDLIINIRGEGYLLRI